VRSIADVNGNMLDDEVAGNQFRESPGYVYCIKSDALSSAIKETKPLLGRNDYAPQVGNNL
jgi:hypothetical protein